MPLGQPQECIRSSNETEYGIIPHFLPEFAQGIHAVAHPSTNDLSPVENEAGIALDGQANHFHPVFQRCFRTPAQTGNSGGNKTHFPQPGQFGNFLRDSQMPVVNGIEGAPKNTDKRNRKIIHYRREKH